MDLYDQKHLKIGESEEFLTVGFLCPAWPPALHPNGIVTYVAALREAFGHLDVESLILTRCAVNVNAEERGIYLLPTIDNDTHLIRRVRNKFFRKFETILSRNISHEFLAHEIQKISKNSGVDLVEVPDTFGISTFLTHRNCIPVGVRLHGPWALVGPPNGTACDDVFHKRVEEERKGILAADGVSAPSFAVLDLVRKYYDIPLPEARVIPNPINLPSEDQCWSLNQADRDTILFVGRFDRVKGADVVIDAVAQLLRNGCKCKLLFVGPDRGLEHTDGKKWGIHEYINAQLPDPDLQRQIKFLGHQSQDKIVHLRRQALLTIVASRYETFPYTVMEAMALGCPLIASDVGGIGEMIQDEGNGLLFQAGDSGELAKRVQEMIQRPEHAAHLGEQARRDCCQRYAPDVVATATLAFYREVIERFDSKK